MKESQKKKLDEVTGLLKKGISNNEIRKELGVSNYFILRAKYHLINSGFELESFRGKKKPKENLHKQTRSDIAREMIRANILNARTFSRAEIARKSGLRPSSIKTLTNEIRKIHFDSLEVSETAEAQSLPENPHIEPLYETYGDVYGGETLLEKYAGIALQGILTNVRTDIKVSASKELASMSFKIAFEMLKEAEEYRKKYKNL